MSVHCDVGIYREGIEDVSNDLVTEIAIVHFGDVDDNGFKASWRSAFQNTGKEIIVNLIYTRKMWSRLQIHNIKTNTFPASYITNPYDEINVP